MRFIGDVHGKFKQYKKIIKDVTESIQVGDMGVGFRYHGQSAMRHGSPCENPPYNTMVQHGARFIRGNHDNPTVCKNHSQWIKDGTIETIGSSKVLFIGGALSIDLGHRLEGYSWWPDEELSNQDLYAMYDLYAETKPDVMVTHECPEYIARAMSHRFEKFEHPSRTRQCFDSMLQEHRPKYWIFGHWHKSFDQEIYGCRFKCLAELEYFDIDL